jgi:hypothetical protein
MYTTTPGPQSHFLENVFLVLEVFVEFTVDFGSIVTLTSSRNPTWQDGSLLTPVDCFNQSTPSVILKTQISPAAHFLSSLHQVVGEMLDLHRII